MLLSIIILLILLLLLSLPLLLSLYLLSLLLLLFFFFLLLSLLGDHGSPYALTRGLVGGFVLGGFWAFLLAHLPLGLGAASARCRIPLVASAKLFALADYTDVLSLKWDDAPASHARRRQARFAAVSATVELGRVRQSAAFERLGRARLDSGVIGDFASKMEACRMGLQLLHLARARLAASGSRHGQLAEVVTKTRKHR